MWPRSEQTAFSCSMRSTRPRYRQHSPHCPRSPCCAGCGRGTLSGRRLGPTTVRSAEMGSASGRRRAVAPGTASSPLTTARLAFGPKPAPAGPATPANVHEAMRPAPIHDALATKGLAPSEHLVDAGYVSAEHLVGARERHGIDLIGPARPDQSWQKQVEGAFQASDFVVEWERRRVRCPEGHESTSWGQTRDKA